MTDFERSTTLGDLSKPQSEGALAAGRAQVIFRADLALVLSDFARTMLTDFRIPSILEQLVHRIVDVLDISGAGVTLISPGVAPVYVAASDDIALRFERLQTDLGEGPCITAYQTGQLVALPDLSSDTRYPAFGPAAEALGLAAVYTFPLRHGEGRFGALDLYRDTTGQMEAEQLTAAQTLADVAAAYLLNAQARQEVLDTADRFRVSGLHDALTGLPNRLLLEERLQQAAHRAKRNGSTAAVLFADLDRFKRVNDSHGHAAGDSLLVAVASRLAALVRPEDTLARVSGDEFVILCEDLSDPQDGEELAERITKAFATPFVVADRKISISASVGVAYSGPGGDINYQLVIDADTAMYQAKRKGGAGHRVIDVGLSHRAKSQLSLEQDLRSAMTGSGLELAYQPILKAAGGLVTGVEALLRWTHPQLGRIAASTAIGIAEQSPLINDIGAWVLERACRDRQRWFDAHPQHGLDVAVNVTARELVNDGFIDRIRQTLETTGMDPSALIVEVTEGSLIEDGPSAIGLLVALRSDGVRVALDDFGTGYSCLNYLRRFPVDIVKVDQGFVADIGRDPAAAAIVTAVNQLSHILGMTVTAEGVETLEQHEQLLRIGCEQVQGHLYAKPMTSEALLELLASTRDSLRFEF